MPLEGRRQVFVTYGFMSEDAIDSAVPEGAQKPDSDLNNVLEVALELAKKHFSNMIQETQVSPQEDVEAQGEYLELKLLVRGDTNTVVSAYHQYLLEWGRVMPLDGRKRVQLAYDFV